jgi:hypothetical protein
MLMGKGAILLPTGPLRVVRRIVRGYLHVPVPYFFSFWFTQIRERHSILTLKERDQNIPYLLKKLKTVYGKFEFSFGNGDTFALEIIAVIFFVYISGILLHEKICCLYVNV